MPSKYQSFSRSSQREYYSVSVRYQGDSTRDWRNAKYNGKRVRELPKTTNTRVVLLIALISTILCCIVAAIVIYFVTHRDNSGDNKIKCPPGISGKECQNATFVGMYAWSGDEHYQLPDGHAYSRGMAFRVFAPKAVNVFVLAATLGGSEQEYSML